MFQSKAQKWYHLKSFFNKCAMFSHLILWWLIMKRANVCSREPDDRMPALCFSNIQFPQLRRRVDNNQKEMSAMSLRSSSGDLRLFLITVSMWFIERFQYYSLLENKANFKGFYLCWKFLEGLRISSLKSCKVSFSKELWMQYIVKIRPGHMHFLAPNLCCLGPSEEVKT